jgi:hypothetical protein
MDPRPVHQEVIARPAVCGPGRSGHQESQRQQHPESGAESVLTLRRPARHLPAETAVRSTITQIYEGTNQIQRMVMARQLLKG